MYGWSGIIYVCDRLFTSHEQKEEKQNVHQKEVSVTVVLKNISA